MRHLRSTLYALVLAPAVWILCGVGFTQDLTGRARDAGSVETASAILLLVLAGAAYAILVFSPISPLGPAVFGLLFLSITLWAMIAPDAYASVWPAGITKDGFDLSRPGYALAALLAVPMLCTALSVRRWRGYEPPQLPLIGTLGRVRGAAGAPGTPVAEQPTAVITAADPTEVIGSSAAAPPPPGQVAPSPVAGVAGPAEQPTEPVPTQPVPVVDAEEPTAVVRPAPASSDEPTTTVVTGPTGDRPGDEPTVLVTPATPASSSADPAGSTPTGDEPTILVTTATPASSSADPAGSAPTGEEPTAAVEAAPSDEPTAAVEPDEVAARDAVAAGREDAAEPLSAEAVAKVAAAEPVVADDEAAPADDAGPPGTPRGSKPAAGEDADTQPVGTDVEPTAAPADESTEANTPESGAATADHEAPTHEIRTVTGDDEPTAVNTREAEPITVDVGGPASQAPADGTGELTQVIRVPVARTDPDADEPTGPLERAERTPGAGLGETTQVIFWREPVDQATPERIARVQAAADQVARDRAAQERARQAFRDRAAQERAKEAFAARAAQDAREHGEQTQVVDLVALRGAPIPGDQTQVLPGAGRTEPADDHTQPLPAGAGPAGDRTQLLTAGAGPAADRARTSPDARTAEPAGDQTQVIRAAGKPAGDRTQMLPRGGMVEPPGDRTQVLSFPSARPIPRPAPGPGERTTDKQEPPTRANSIISAEQPDPAADPTTRLSLPRPATAGAGADTTADVGDNRRTKGVLDLERPADESADDTRQLVVPQPRRPQDDEPTTRL